MEKNYAMLIKAPGDIDEHIIPVLLSASVSRNTPVRRVYGDFSTLSEKWRFIVERNNMDARQIYHTKWDDTKVCHLYTFANTTKVVDAMKRDFIELCVGQALIKNIMINIVLGENEVECAKQNGKKIILI